MSLRGKRHWDIFTKMEAKTGAELMILCFLSESQMGTVAKDISTLAPVFFFQYIKMAFSRHSNPADSF